MSCDTNYFLKGILMKNEPKKTLNKCHTAAKTPKTS